MSQDDTITSLRPNSFSISDYTDWLARIGTSVLPGAGGTYWIRYETGGLVRLPTFDVSPPQPGEIQRVLWQGRVGVAAYVMSPDDQHPANAWLYVCRGRSYNPEKLSKPARRDMRRSQRNFRFGTVDWPTLLANGLEAYADTRRRVGLSDGTRSHFLRRFETFSRNPAHHVYGAWNEDALVAFVTLIIVDSWVEIEGSFSANACLRWCPNDGLAHQVLDEFLVRRGFQIVSYGLSSVQEDSTAAGLHSYKTKIGFDAEPVHRAFAVHPFVRPFATPLTLWVVKSALHLRPGNRRLKKAHGVLSSLLNDQNFGRDENRNGIS